VQLSDKRKTPEMAAAEQREVDAQVKRATARYLEDSSITGDDLRREYRGKVARLAIAELTRLGKYPRPRTDCETYRHALAPGDYGGAYSQVNYKTWRARR